MSAPVCCHSFRATGITVYETSGVALALKTDVPSSQVEDEEGRTHLLIHLPIEEEDEDRWCLWRPDNAGFDSRSIFGSINPAVELPQEYDRRRTNLRAAP